MSVINENSTTKEILSGIRYTVSDEEFEVYQGIVVQREDDLKAELKKSKEDYVSLEKKNCIVLLDKLELEKELNSIKMEICLRKKKRFLSEAETHAYADQNMKKPKIETDEEALIELRNENKKLKEELELYRKMFPDHLNRMVFIEAKLADFMEKHPSNFLAENVADDNDHNHHSPDDSTCAKILNSIKPTAIQSPNLLKESKFESFQANATKHGIHLEGIAVAGSEAMPMGSKENTPRICLNLHSFASDLKNEINEPLTEGGETMRMGSRENAPSTGLNLQNPASDLKE